MRNKLFNRLWLFSAVYLLSIQLGLTQGNVGIGTNQPNAHAALQIVAPNGNQGLLIPGLTTSQRTDNAFTSNLSADENGLMVFDLDQKTFYYWMDDQWQPIVSGSVANDLIGGAGIEVLENGEIINTGDTDSTNDITTSTLAEGDLEGSFPNLSIAEEAVNTSKIANNAVNSEKIANNSILTEDINSPGAGKVLITTSGGTVFWENQTLFGITFLPTGRIYVGDNDNKPSPIDARGVGNILVGNGTSVSSVAVGGDVSMNGSGNVQIQADVITATEIASGAVGSDEIIDGQVSTNDLANLSVNSAKMADNAVSSSKLADNAVTTVKLANNTVDATKLADNSVTTVKIQDEAITNADINNSAAIAGSKINPDFGAQNILTSGTINAQAATFTAKVTSDVTTASDPTNTLVTKGYVDAADALEVPITQLSPLADANIIVGSGGTNQSVAISGDATINTSGVLTLNNTAAARTNLGLGSMSTQNDNSVAIIGGSINATSIGSSTPAAGAFTTISGDGSSITGLDAANIASGTLNQDRLPDVGAAGSFGGSGNYIESITVDAKGRVTAVSEDVPPSDKRLKKNINPLGSSLNKVLDMQPAQYEWKDPKREGISYGLIAQELAKIYPQLVKKRSDGYFGINYMELIPVLVKAIQEQQQEIDILKNAGHSTTLENKENLEKEVDQLKAENEQLQVEIEMIKKAIGLSKTSKVGK